MKYIYQKIVTDRSDKLGPAEIVGIKVPETLDEIIDTNYKKVSRSINLEGDHIIDYDVRFFKDAVLRGDLHASLLLLGRLDGNSILITDDSRRLNMLLRKGREALNIEKLVITLSKRSAKLKERSSKDITPTSLTNDPLTCVYVNSKSEGKAVTLKRWVTKVRSNVNNSHLFLVREKGSSSMLYLYESKAHTVGLEANGKLLRLDEEDMNQYTSAACVLLGQVTLDTLAYAKLNSTNTFVRTQSDTSDSVHKDSLKLYSDVTAIYLSLLRYSHTKITEGIEKGVISMDAYKKPSIGLYYINNKINLIREKNTQRNAGYSHRHVKRFKQVYGSIMKMAIKDALKPTNDE